MKKHVIAGTSLVIVVILTLFVFLRGDSATKVNVFEHLSKLESFEMKSIKDQFVVVHFWAKWCEPCTEEIPHLVEFAKKASDATTGIPKLKILAISLDPNLEESRSILPNKGEGLPSNFILALDAEHKVAESMGSYQYPETYFVDPNGAVVEKWVGPQKWNTTEVFEFFRARAK